MRRPWTVLLLPLILGACGDRGEHAQEQELPAPEVAEAEAPAPAAAEEPDMAPGSACDAGAAEWAIGQAANEDLLARARDDADAETARFLRPNEAITLEYMESRLNLELDEHGTVISLRCG